MSLLPARRPVQSAVAESAPAAPAAPVVPGASAIPVPGGATASRAGGAVVLIPALDPGPELVDLVRELRTAGVGTVIVDDGSPERSAVTFDRCELLGAVVLHLPVNQGKGAALRRGFSLVASRFPGAGVVTADADGQHRLADVLQVREVLDARTAAGADPAIVLGVRTADRGAVPLRSRLGNAVSAAAFRAVSGVRLEDTQTGLRGVPSSLLAWSTTLPGNRYEYEYVQLVAAARAGIALHQVPISTVYIEDNASSHFRPLRDSARVLGPVLAFAATGLGSFAVDTALFLGLAALGAPAWLALVLARVLSAAGNFTANRHLVFREGRRVPLGRSLLRYAVLAAGVLAGGVLVVDALLALGESLLVAKLTADLLLFVLSYLVQRLVVFRDR